MKEVYLVVLAFAAGSVVFSAGVLLCKMRREQKNALGYRDRLSRNTPYCDYLDCYENEGYDEARR